MRDPVGLLNGKVPVPTGMPRALCNPLYSVPRQTAAQSTALYPPTVPLTAAALEAIHISWGALAATAGAIGPVVEGQRVPLDLRERERDGGAE